MLERPHLAPQSCTKTSLILKAKLVSSSPPPLQPCLLQFKLKTNENKKIREGKRIEEKRMVKLDVSLNQTAHFETCKKKKQPQHICIFRAWSFLLVHIWFTPTEKPKGFVFIYLFIK